LAFASSVAYLAVAGTIRTDGATVAATLLLDAISRQRTHGANAGDCSFTSPGSPNADSD
jgi:hypothetical protein